MVDPNEIKSLIHRYSHHIENINSDEVTEAQKAMNAISTKDAVSAILVDVVTRLNMLIK
jgi:hypothetical protein